jgi:hypothetical protein
MEEWVDPRVQRSLIQVNQRLPMGERERAVLDAITNSGKFLPESPPKNMHGFMRESRRNLDAATPSWEAQENYYKRYPNVFHRNVTLMQYKLAEFGPEIKNIFAFEQCKYTECGQRGEGKCPRIHSLVLLTALQNIEFRD